MCQELHSHSGGVVLVWHKKSNMLLLQFPNPTPPHPHNPTMSFNNNNNNNNNNNSGRCNNHYIVLVPVVTPASSLPANAGNSRQLARAAVADATKHEQDHRMAVRIACAASHPSFICCTTSTNAAAGNNSSSGAKNGSQSSGSHPHYTSHIHCSMVTPLPVVDKMRRYQSMNVPDHWNIIAQESADFISSPHDSA